MPVTFTNDRYTPIPKEFVAPKAWNHPLAEAGVDLVKAIGRQGWDVPGIEVEFRTVDDDRGGKPYRYVSRIRGQAPEWEPFSLQFSQFAERSPVAYSAAASPGVEATRHEDGSGGVRIYVGKDWKADGEEFVAGRYGAGAKLDGKPETYHVYRSNRVGKLEPENDMGREYVPKPGKESRMTLNGVYERLNRALNQVVRTLNARPAVQGYDDLAFDGDANLRRMAQVEPAPMQAEVPTLYVWAEPGSFQHILEAKQGIGRDDNPPKTLFKLGSYWRLCALSVSQSPEMGGPFPKVAYDGFDYASQSTHPKVAHSTFSIQEGSVPVEVKLANLQDVYVVDYAVRENLRHRAEERATAERRTHFTAQESNSFEAGVARTLVPAVEYRGGYENPVYCIGRDLSIDELRPLVGHVYVLVDDEGTRVLLSDESGEEFILDQERCVKLCTQKSAIRTARDIVWTMTGDWDKKVDVFISPEIEERASDDRPRAEDTAELDRILGLDR